MLKTVSSITNAIGALNYKGTWNASTNTPALASGVGTKGDYYVVSVAGATNLDGETLWGVGDWAVFNGAAWQRLEGGSTINATTVTANSYNKMAITAPATSSTLAVADGKTFTASNTITVTGTDGTTMTFPTTSATIARTDAAQTFTGTQTFGETILGTNAAKVFNSGGVSIGNTTDPGATNLSVTGSTTSSSFMTYKANTGSLAHNTYVTLFTASSGLYTVACYLVAGKGSPNSYASYATVFCDGNSSRIVANNMPYIDIALSGNDVQVRQLSGATQSTGINYSYIKQTLD